MNDNADMKPPELPGEAPPLSRADTGGAAAGVMEAQPAAGVRPLQSLAVQVPLLLVIALSLAVAAGAWGLRTIVLRSFERLEVANAELDLRRFANAVDHEVRLLGEQLTFAIDSGSDDPLLPDLLPLGPDLASASLPDLACIFDGQGALRSTDSDDRAGRLFHRVNPIDFCSRAEGDPAVVRALAGERLAGLHELGETFFIIAVAPIPAASPLADAGAVLLLARHLSEEELEALAARMAVNIDFWSMETADMDVLAAAAGAALSLGAPIIVNKRSDDVLQVYWAFQDASASRPSSPAPTCSATSG
jgi:hypothetical protein